MTLRRLMLAWSVAGALATALGPATVRAQSHREDVGLRIRAYRHRTVDQAIVRKAQEVANDLLAAAGIQVAWRMCETSEPCGLEKGTAPEVVVSFSARDRATRRGDCGAAALGSDVAEGTVIIAAPCVAEAARRLARRLGRDPMLAWSNSGDLLGAVVAHEVGHVLGLKHRSDGLMRTRLGAEDIVSLRRGRLGFSEPESGHMRAAVGAAIARTPQPPHGSRAGNPE